MRWEYMISEWAASSRTKKGRSRIAYLDRPFLTVGPLDRYVVFANTQRKTEATLWRLPLIDVDICVPYPQWKPTLKSVLKPSIVLRCVVYVARCSKRRFALQMAPRSTRFLLRLEQNSAQIFIFSRLSKVIARADIKKT